jgi:flagellar basal body-associated protein FliL
MGFWIGIGAAQATARAKGVKRAHRPRRIISILLGILVALLITAGLLIVFWKSYQ